MKFSVYAATATLSIATALLLVSPVITAVTQSEVLNQEGLALEIAPPVLNFLVEPGETIKSEIAIRDVSTSPLVVTSEINDFTSSGEENGNPKVITDDQEPSPYTIKNWVSPFPQMTLKPKQLEKLPLEIKIPADAAPGGYYGVVRFTATAPNADTNGVSLAPSLGALIMIRVKGAAYEKLEIKEFYMTKDGKPGAFFESIPFDFVERVENQGNVYEQPTGNILIKDMFGQPVANVNVNADNRNVLPNSVRKYTQTFDNTALGTATMFGRYTADLKLNYGDKLSVTSSITFWVIPWRLIIVGIVLLVAAVIGLRVGIKRYNDRIVGRSRQSRRR
ncbi:hypothetical protein EOL96_00865 [Candidatus Saccharibacteria bacterium]|nr:hypothetical protein [Candidatus Saccharibacteria bacterium]